MEIVIKLSQFLLSLSLLIVLHELGHFIPAKLFKTRVEKFYLFFDVKFSLVKKKIGETVYGIGWLPLGGYVKIAGMIDESMDKEQMALPPQPWEFRSKPAWQRLIIMLGGVTVNFILAIIIYIGMAYVYGNTYISNSELKDGIWVASPIGEKIGFKTGDKIIAVDGKKVEKFDDVQYNVNFAKTATIERNGAVQEIKLPVDLLSKIMKEERSYLKLRVPFTVANISEDSPNTNTLKKGDIILSIDSKKMKYADEILAFNEANAGKTFDAVVFRDEKEQPVKVTVGKDGKLGVMQGGLKPENLEKLGYYKISRETFSLAESFPAGIQRSKDELGRYFTQLKAIVNPDTGAYKGVGGFYAIFNVFPSVWSWEYFWTITAFLSIMLGVMNLLPIPALDGGHVMFLLFEIITRKKPSEKFLERAQVVGFFILIALVLFANGNDIYKAIVK
ncbi:RIP metalloprotease RseP [Flavobacterium lindanitolerans]|uniref:Zinc metalloprotease n=1 Tax=Flavobacterium lindanitolerans TaxID=428988 RepID=A0A497UX95_9FLAO|nr:RIP metalloprotease RseP [Flavobacterium lindanitolerans]PKW28755.1 regulator of sigma E protease [Flavobacterium lindanitolerans]RLJ35741.1 regulator of sigma E protease [Flavobacterium lindanitolerans]